MVVQVRKIERPNPQNREIKQWYMAKAPSVGVDLNGIAAGIEKRSAMTKGDILAVLTNLTELISEHLSNGLAVKLGSFGTFYGTVSSNPAPTEEEANPALIKSMNIRFLPGTDMKKMVADVKYKAI